MFRFEIQMKDNELNKHLKISGNDFKEISFTHDNNIMMIKTVPPDETNLWVHDGEIIK